MSRKIRLMIVDDSILFRSFLVQNLGADPRFEVVGYAINALDAKNKLPVLKPDIMTLDIEMPGMSGMDFLREVLPIHPVPVILVSSLNVRVFDALAAGAIDFVRKPDMEQDGGKSAFLAALKSKLAIGANARVRLPSQYTGGSSIGAGAPGSSHPGAPLPCIMAPWAATLQALLPPRPHLPPPALAPPAPRLPALPGCR